MNCAPPIRFRSLRAFEMDHVKEISAGGLTVKENLRMITRKQNLEKERQRRLSKA